MFGFFSPPSEYGFGYAAAGFAAVAIVGMIQFWMRRRYLAAGGGLRSFAALQAIPSGLQQPVAPAAQDRGGNQAGNREGLFQVIVKMRYPEVSPGKSSPDAIPAPEELQEIGAALFETAPLDPAPDDIELPQQTGIVHSGVLTINFVHLSEPFKARADQQLRETESRTSELNQAIPSSPVKPTSKRRQDFVLLEHTAVMSTQFDDLHRVVSTSQVTLGQGPANEEPSHQIERLERIEDTSLREGSYEQAAAALSARITLLRTQHGSKHPDLAALYLRLADLCIVLGKPEDAEPCQLRALEIQAHHGDYGSGPVFSSELLDLPLTDSEIQQFSQSVMGLSSGLSLHAGAEYPSGSAEDAFNSAEIANDYFRGIKPAPQTGPERIDP